MNPAKFIHVAYEDKHVGNARKYGKSCGKRETVSYLVFVIIYIWLVDKVTEVFQAHCLVS